MRKTLLILFCLMLGLTASAQPKLNHEEIYVGAHGGVIAGMYRFTPSVEQDWKHPFWGWNGGLVFRYAGHKVCGMQLEINYMQRGWHESKTDYQRQLDYIEVPFLMHLYFGKKARGFINLGPQIGYCFRSVNIGDIPSPYNTVVGTDKESSQTAHQYAKIEKPFDWGIAGGVGFYYRSRWAGVYQLEARFNWSFGNSFKDSKMDYFDYSSPYNLSLNFAYMWQVKGDK